jgi:hypothetical protein
VEVWAILVFYPDTVHIGIVADLDLLHVADLDLLHCPS